MSHLDNLILNTDSYKASHWLQYPPGTDAAFFYVESRGGHNERTLFFGLQAIIKQSLLKPITHADVDEARDFFAAQGEPFNEAGWRYIVDAHGGRLRDAHPRRARGQRGADAQVTQPVPDTWSIPSCPPATRWSKGVTLQASCDMRSRSAGGLAGIRHGRSGIPAS